MPLPITPLEDRFWAKVDKRGPDDCWPWTAWRSHSGYGYIQRGKRSDGLVPAHRVSWELTNGTIPDGLWILHKCDNPCCVNPNHLRLGTPKDNSLDMVSKDRHARGERDGFAKITNDIVRRIKARCQAGESDSAIAADYGVHRLTVSRVRRRTTWRHIA